MKSPKILQNHSNSGIARLREKCVIPYAKLRPFTGKIHPFYGLGSQYVSGTYFLRRKYVFPDIPQKPYISPISYQNMVDQNPKHDQKLT